MAAPAESITLHFRNLAGATHTIEQVSLRALIAQVVQQVAAVLEVQRPLLFINEEQGVNHDHNRPVWHLFDHADVREAFTIIAAPLPHFTSAALQCDIFRYHGVLINRFLTIDRQDNTSAPCIPPGRRFGSVVSRRNDRWAIEQPVIDLVADISPRNRQPFRQEGLLLASEPLQQSADFKVVIELHGANQEHLVHLSNHYLFELGVAAQHTQPKDNFATIFLPPDYIGVFEGQRLLSHLREHSVRFEVLCRYVREAGQLIIRHPVSNYQRQLDTHGPLLLLNLVRPEPNVIAQAWVEAVSDEEATKFNQ